MPNDSDNNLKSNDFTEQRNQAVSSAVTALVLINGGATVALLAFLQAMWDKNSGAMYAIVAGMLVYSLGVLFAALISLFRYQASLHFQGGNDAKYHCYHFCFYAAWVGSMVAFLFGSLVVAVGIFIALCQR